MYLQGWMEHLHGGHLAWGRVHGGICMGQEGSWSNRTAWLSVAMHRVSYGHRYGHLSAESNNLSPCAESAMATITGTSLRRVKQCGASMHAWPLPPALSTLAAPFSPPPLPPRPSPAPSQADLNGDGHLEIILATQDLKIQVWVVGGSLGVGGGVQGKGQGSTRGRTGSQVTSGRG